MFLVKCADIIAQSVIQFILAFVGCIIDICTCKCSLCSKVFLYSSMSSGICKRCEWVVQHTETPIQRGGGGVKEVDNFR